jgi:hypothetical protein
MTALGKRLLKRLTSKERLLKRDSQNKIYLEEKNDSPPKASSKIYLTIKKGCLKIFFKKNSLPGKGYLPIKKTLKKLTRQRLIAFRKLLK